MGTAEWAVLATFLTLAGGAVAWAVATWWQTKVHREEREEAAEERTETARARDQGLLMQQLERNASELAGLAPTLAALRKEYVETAAREIALMDQIRELKASNEAERRKLLAMIGGLSMRLADLRRYFTDTTGHDLPPVEDPLGILAEAIAEARATGVVAEPLPKPKGREDGQ